MAFEDLHSNIALYCIVFVPFLNRNLFLTATRPWDLSASNLNLPQMSGENIATCCYLEISRIPIQSISSIVLELCHAVSSLFKPSMFDYQTVCFLDVHYSTLATVGKQCKWNIFLFSRCANSRKNHSQNRVHCQFKCSSVHVKAMSVELRR